MSDEFEHDSSVNPAEEEDSPSRIRIIMFAIIGYSLVACAGYFFFFQLSADNLLTADEESNERVVAVSADFPSALYFAPADDRLLTSQQIASANLQVINDPVELATTLGNYPEIRTIYIHPAMLEQVDAAVFRRQYEARKLLVAINTPMSELTAAVGITQSVPDLPLEEFVSGTAVAALQARENGPPLEFVATYSQFDQIPGVIVGLR